MDIRKLIKEAIATVLSEDAKDFNNFGPNVGLVVMKPSAGHVWLNFFDFGTMKCVGVITVRHLEEDKWCITTVAAEQGFGPLMYKAGMMAVYPGKVCADKIGVPAKAAINVWHKFFLNSGELKREPISQDSMIYKDYGDVDLNIILNQLYSRPESTWFKKFVDRGNLFMKEKNVDVSFIRHVSSEYFKERYSER